MYYLKSLKNVILSIFVQNVLSETTFLVKIWNKAKERSFGPIFIKFGFKNPYKLVLAFPKILFRSEHVYYSKTRFFEIWRVKSTKCPPYDQKCKIKLNSAVLDRIL